MRISDWSSDVCSSDLRIDGHDDRPFQALGGVHGVEGDGFFLSVGPSLNGTRFVGPGRRHGLGKGAKAPNRKGGGQAQIEIDVRSEERRVGKSVSVRLDHGGRRNIKKKK